MTEIHTSKNLTNIKNQTASNSRPAALPIFRVKSRSQQDQWYHIMVVPAGYHICSCGLDYCSHVDASVVHGIDSVVHPDDEQAWITAASFLDGLVQPPKNWKSSWRTDRVWLGLSPKKPVKDPRSSGKPIACFLGKHTDAYPKRSLIKEARRAGWTPVQRISPWTTIIIVPDEPDEPLPSNAIAGTFLEKNEAQILVITAHFWLQIQEEFLEQCAQKIADLENQKFDADPPSVMKP